VGGVDGLHDGPPLVLGDYNGHELPFGLQLQIVGLLQVLQSSHPGLDHGAAPGSLLLGGGHDGIGVASVAGHQNQGIFPLLLHLRLPSVSFFDLVGLKLHQGGGQIVQPRQGQVEYEAGCPGAPPQVGVQIVEQSGGR